MNNTQTSLLTPSPVALPPVTYKGQPVVTTEMLAGAYGCSAKNIRDNFTNNRERFVEGKHFYSLANSELAEFRLHTENFGSQMSLSAKARNLTIWLERGAARHAKMLNTDKAWDVFEVLEETFFRVMKPVVEAPALDTASRLSLRTDPERKELTAMVNAWVNSAPIGYAAARTIINAHFGVKSVDDMTVEQVRGAIAIVQGKIAEGQTALLPARTEADELECLFRDWKSHFRSMAEIQREIFHVAKDGMRPALRDISSPRRTIAIQAYTAMERLFYSLDNGLEAAEATVRTALIASRM